MNFERVLSPLDGFPSLICTSLSYDKTIDALVVGSYRGVSLYYPSEDRVEIQEETDIYYMDDWHVEVIPLWSFQTHHIYMRTYCIMSL